MEQLLLIVYRNHAKKLYKFFYYKTLSRESSEDLTSETFLAFAEWCRTQKDKKDNADLTEDAVVPYLYGIAKNKFLKFLQDKYRFWALSFDEEYIENFVDDMDRPKGRDLRIEKYLKLLPSRQRAVIELRLVEKLNLSEIAERLGKDMNYVKTTQKRAIKSLRKIVMCTP